ncbi:MAG: hypothetical protein EAX86_13315 [Candidatus Heimdallarchaeota archaeon]|nr:hypothetical protein [Candidatus Heimdallarchaeota archaeon]
MFDRNNHISDSNEREAYIEALTGLGKIKRIEFHFMVELCNHSGSKPICISWKDLPILRYRCHENRAEFEIQHSFGNFFFQLLQPIICLTYIRHIAILADLRLPSWSENQEFIIILNRYGGTFIIPSNENFSLFHLKKLETSWKIRGKKILELKNNLDLIDVIAPETFSPRDFRITV